MNQNENYHDSLCEIVQKVSCLNNRCCSIEKLVCTVKYFESNIQSLEARIQNVQQEVEHLIATSQHPFLPIGMTQVAKEKSAAKEQ